MRQSDVNDFGAGEILECGEFTAFDLLTGSESGDKSPHSKFSAVRFTGYQKVQQATARPVTDPRERYILYTLLVFKLTAWKSGVFRCPQKPS